MYFIQVAILHIWYDFINTVGHTLSINTPWNAHCTNVCNSALQPAKIMPTYSSLTSNHGPHAFLASTRFLAHKVEWSAHRNFTPVPFSIARTHGCVLRSYTPSQCTLSVYSSFRNWYHWCDHWVCCYCWQVSVNIIVTFISIDDISYKMDIWQYLIGMHVFCLHRPFLLRHSLICWIISH